MSALPDSLVPGLPPTALAPMQDVTTLEFMKVVARCGAPDFYFTEYFRVHAHSVLEKHILQSITEHGTGRPVFAQMIGEQLEDLRRTALNLQAYPIAGVDLNLGCPAPKIYKKNVGGGLLRDPTHVDRIFGMLRETVAGRFTVKMRIGFEDTENFATLLELINRHQIDLLSLHGRTVAEGYRSEVHYDRIRQAAATVNCPVLANGNLFSARFAREVLDYTGAAGVMIGRHAIRNPWIFRQFREQEQGLEPFQPRLHDVRDYILDLEATMRNPEAPERAQMNRLKKFLNFIGLGVDPEGHFLHRARRIQTRKELQQLCQEFLIDNGRAELPFATEPYSGLVARPNCEAPHRPAPPLQTTTTFS